MSNRLAYDRLRKELVRLQKSPVDHIVAAPLDSDILVWWYVIAGPAGSPYEGGLYLGKLTFPPQYPFKPPSIQMHTPSGRFKPDTRLCLSMSDFHPETWNPLWSVSSILAGLLSFMLESTPTQGSVETDDHTKRELARRSLEYNKRNPVFKRLFPQFCGDTPHAAAVAASAQLAQSAAASAASAAAPTSAATAAASPADSIATASSAGAAVSAPVAAAAPDSSPPNPVAAPGTVASHHESKPARSHDKEARRGEGKGGGSETQSICRTVFRGQVACKADCKGSPEGLAQSTRTTSASRSSSQRNNRSSGQRSGRIHRHFLGWLIHSLALSS